MTDIEALAKRVAESERAGFETWAKKHAYDITPHHVEDGQYKRHDTFIAWTAWQAALTTAPRDAGERIYAEGKAAGLEEATNAQPSTAENPNEDAYQRGRFDGVMEYATAIRALATVKP